MILLKPLLITIGVEFIIASLLLRKNLTLVLVYSILVNSFTLPLANYGYQTWILHAYLDVAQKVMLLPFLTIEVAVFATEGILWYHVLGISYRRAFILSFCTNLVTASLSFI